MVTFRLGRWSIVAALVLSLCVGGTVHAQCLLNRLFNRPQTYAAEYRSYPMGYTAYLPVQTVPTTTYMPVTYSVPTVTYRVAYSPVAPSLGTTVYRPAPVLASSVPPVVVPYAVASPVATPTVVYRPVEIVVERRRLFPWRPFERWQARRMAYTVPQAVPSWTTSQFATYAIPMTPSACDPCSSGSAYMGAVSAIPSSGCSTCGASSTGLPLSAADTTPTLPSPAASSSSSSQPPSTYAPNTPASDTQSWKPSGEAGVQGTGLPSREESRPLIRQAVFVQPIPLIEDGEGALPLVEVQGWKRH